MIKRIYIDNFKCLVNFELKPEGINLFFGKNGSGKTAVFSALRLIKDLVVEGKKLDELVDSWSLTRWDLREIQQFELDIDSNGGMYSYLLKIEHSKDLGLSRIKEEKLSFNGNPLFEYSVSDGEGTAQLYRDDFSAGPSYPVDWTRSGISALQERKDNQLLSNFKKRLSRVIIVQICPGNMLAESRQESRNPTADLSNFASWYRYLSQEYQGKTIDLTQELREIMPGFDSFRLAEAGEARILMAGFQEGGKPKKKTTFYRFSELSDGQRALIALYTLLICQPDEYFTLCIDEPENNLALPEIQPWLDLLDEMVQEEAGQALLISHHPNLINYLADNQGVWFEREHNGPVRSQRILPSDKEGLSLAKLIEMGWIYDD